jgi:hypothetical protein
MTVPPLVSLLYCRRRFYARPGSETAAAIALVLASLVALALAFPFLLPLLIPLFVVRVFVAAVRGDKAGDG